MRQENGGNLIGKSGGCGYSIFRNEGIFYDNCRIDFCWAFWARLLVTKIAKMVMAVSLPLTKGKNPLCPFPERASAMVPNDSFRVC
jgi:hypothetical protein